MYLTVPSSMLRVGHYSYIVTIQDQSCRGIIVTVIVAGSPEHNNNSTYQPTTVYSGVGHTPRRTKVTSGMMNNGAIVAIPVL
jgi:hypothetical protein